MEAIKIIPKEKESSINPIPNESIKIKKNKKKSKKIKKEKKYHNLKEILEDMHPEKKNKLKENKNTLIKPPSLNYQKKDSETTIDTSFNADKINYSKINTFDFTLSSNYIIKKIIGLSEETNEVETDLKSRKLSSPIIEYYKGCDIILQKEENDIIDFNKSLNFVNKNKFIIKIEGENTSNKNENKFNSDLNIYDNYINYPMAYNYNEFYSNDIQKSINNINYNIYNNYYSPKYFYKNKKGNPANIRKGDWTCPYCFNINFSFRKICNRCNAPKQNY